MKGIIGTLLGALLLFYAWLVILFVIPVALICVLYWIATQGVEVESGPTITIPPPPPRPRQWVPPTPPNWEEDDTVEMPIVVIAERVEPSWDPPK